jgi:hypothetical protein
MQNQKRGIKLLYKLMFFFMDLENLMWWIADHLIFPVALFRRYIAKKINQKLKSGEINMEPIISEAKN